MAWYNPGILARLGGLSVVSFALLLGVTSLLHEAAGWRAGNAYSAALALVLVVNFLVMRYRIYRSREGAWRQLAVFVGASLGFRLLERLAFAGLHGGLGLQYQAAVVLISCVFTGLKYMAYGKWIFRSGAPSQKAG